MPVEQRCVIASLAPLATPAPIPAHPARTEAPAVNDDINVLALVKGKERYIFLYDDSQKAEALRMLGRHAANPELSFSWYDAAVLGKKIRHEGSSRSNARFTVPQSSDIDE
jgi:hypothetical protein